MTRKRDQDNRQEPSDGSGSFRVDRVFIPKPARPPTAADVMPQSRTSPTRLRSPSVTPDTADTELSLRRGLSRLQRQLAEAQRELANKDDELAAEVEKRNTAFASYDSLLEDHRTTKTQLDELIAYEERTATIEKQLTEALANMEELVASLDRERKQRTVEQARVEELTRALGDAHIQWSTERSAIENKAAAEIEQLETDKRAALTAAEQATTSTAARLREVHDRELTELRTSHERAVSTRRGELEPKALEARELAVERERLAGELSAQRNESARVAAERAEAHAREIAGLTDTHTREQSTQARLYATELARAQQERDAQTLALQQASRSADARAQAHEHELAELRDGHKRLERELTEARDRIAKLDAEHISAEELLNTASATTDRLFEDKRMLEEQLQTSQADARRNSLDRLRFVAYLEEGLALLGALPPTSEEDEPDISVE